MVFDWNADTIKRYRAAAARTGFFDALAALLRPRLKGVHTLCDMGCGLGLVDIALAPYVEDITCVDVSGPAVKALRADAAARGIDNIRVLQADAFALEGAWDVIHISFFAGHQLARFLPRCRRLLAVVSLPGEEQLYPGRYRRPKLTAEAQREKVQALGAAYTCTEAELEFGQPLTSRADAEAFVRVYAPDIPQGELEAFLNARLVETGYADYPLYMPRKKRLAILEVAGGAK